MDFVIKDEGHLAALFHYAWRKVYGQSDSEFMGVFGKLKFKMKLGFECFRQGCQLHVLILDAISKTIDEKKALAIDTVQKFMYSEDGVPAFSTSNKP